MTDDRQAWQPLLDELDRWSEAGNVATFWWRDDDAIEPTFALDRMLALVNRFQVPLGLAVIPATATPQLADRLRNEKLVEVLQHGYRHKNHATPGERAAEFGPQRTFDVRRREIEAGRLLLKDFNLVPIFVPPWNRYEKALVREIEFGGLKAISAFGAPDHQSMVIIECNCQIDIISWRTTRGFAGVEKSVHKIVDHLIARRTGKAASLGSLKVATGLLTHHLDHDEGCWTFLGELFTRLKGHPAVKWITPMVAVSQVELP
ncbi:MAG: polysaccharide deacetylase family protein [Hyphomicrobiaceae bacterium]